MNGAGVATVRITTSDGVWLHADIERPESVRGGAVICHPHPQYGGTSQSWLVPMLQEALAETGFVALRFDFRGAGRSEGRFGGGVEEQLDVAAALSIVREDVGADVPIVLGGWSFGAAVSLRCMLTDEDVAAWFGIALPVGPGVPATSEDELRECGRPLLFAHGGQDTVAPLDAIRPLIDTAPRGELALVEEADHMFTRGAGAMRGAVVDFVDRVS